MEGYTSNQNFADEQGNVNPNRMIPTGKALEIINDCASLGVRGVQFTGGGEPTVHPDHLRIMREALDSDLACGMVSNGCLLRPGWEDVYPCFRWVRISMDAGRVEDYTRIRKVKDSMWYRMLDNMEKLAKAEVPSLGSSFIATKDNKAGVYSAARHAYDAGAKYFRVGAFYNPQMANYYNADDVREIEEQIDLAKSELPEGFVFDQFTKRLEYMSRRPEKPFCFYQHVNVYIGGDQKVYRCCEMSYNDRGELGSLENQSFKEFWESREADDNYRCFDARGCPTCPFHTKVELGEFMTRDDISDYHPEFP